jgi:hypothetical protein
MTMAKVASDIRLMREDRENIRRLRLRERLHKIVGGMRRCLRCGCAFKSYDLKLVFLCDRCRLHNTNALDIG